MMSEEEVDDLEEGLDLDESQDEPVYMTMAGLPDLQHGLPTHIDMRAVSLSSDMGPPQMITADYQ